MPNLEPSYLRYVHDKLISGALNPENASALPRGFIGLYEREFTQRTPVIERKSTLEQLALWSLTKGPVSARFIACILDLGEQESKELVNRYSSWFNSPEIGKYQLYHSTLVTFQLAHNQ